MKHSDRCYRNISKESILTLTLFCLAVLPCQSQQPPSPTPRTPDASTGATTNKEVTFPEPAIATPDERIPDCANFKSDAHNQYLARIPEIDVQRIAAALREDLEKPNELFEFSKNVFTNVISSRLDSYLFGGSSVAIISAALGLISAAFDLIRKSKQKTKYPESASKAARTLELAPTIVLLLTSAFFTFAIWSSRGATGASVPPPNAQLSALELCQLQLDSCQNSPSTGSVLDALHRAEAECATTRSDSSKKFTELRENLEKISDSQIGSFKQYAVLVIILAIVVGVGYLVHKVYNG